MPGCPADGFPAAVNGVSTPCSPPANGSAYPIGVDCAYTCAYGYTVGGFFAMKGAATCTAAGVWLGDSGDLSCKLDLGMLGVVGGVALVVLVAAFAGVLVCIRRKGGARGYRGLSAGGGLASERSDPFARPGRESLLEGGEDPFATVPERTVGGGGGVPAGTRGNRPAARSTGSSSRGTGGALTSQAIAKHRVKHKHSNNAAVDRWTNDAASVKSRDSSSKVKAISDSVLFDDLTDEEEQAGAASRDDGRSRASKRHKKKKKKKSSKKDKKETEGVPSSTAASRTSGSKGRSGSYDDTGSSVGSGSAARSDRSSSKKSSKKHRHKSKSEAAERAAQRLSKSAQKKQRGQVGGQSSERASTALVVTAQPEEALDEWGAPIDKSAKHRFGGGGGGGGGGSSSSKSAKKKDKRKKKDKHHHNNNKSPVPAKATTTATTASSDSEVELARQTSSPKAATSGGAAAGDFDDTASVYSEQSYVTEGGTRQTRRVPSRTRGRYRRKTSRQRLAARQMALPGMAASKLKKTSGGKGNGGNASRPLAPVLETEHEAVTGPASAAAAASTPSSSTAMVVSNKGTLDDSDDDFFS